MTRQISRQELYALGEPFGASATRKKPGGRGLILGGGGDGGVRYENLDRLYEMQANQGQQMMDFANKNVYPAFESMMSESKDVGSIANQELAATQAGADVQGSIGQGRKQLSEDLASMGVDPSDPRYANTMAKMELEGAAMGASAQTGARDKAKQLGYAKMKDAVSLGMGIPSDATSALNSAGQFASTSANIQAQGAQTQAMNQGNVAALAGRFLFADGGEVKSPSRLAVGGFPMKNSIVAPPPPVTAPVPSQGMSMAKGVTQSTMSPGKPGPLTNAIMGNSKVGDGGMKVGALVEKAGEMAGSGNTSAFGQGMRLGKDAKGAADAYQGAADAATAAGNAAANSIGTATADAAAQYGVSAAGEQAGMLAAQEMGMGTLATEATAAATATEMGGIASAMGAGSAVAAALPWVGGAMLVGTALGLFADGGSVNKQRLAVADGTKGGNVSGPGGPKDDLIPAMLSDGEFVMPVGTVKLYGTEVLEKMRQDGLAHEKQIGIGRTA